MARTSLSSERVFVNVLLVHLILPLFLILFIVMLPPEEDVVWVIFFLVTAIYIAFIDVAGAWSWLGSGIRFTLPVILVAAAALHHPQFPSFGAVSSGPGLELFGLIAGLVLLAAARLAFALRRRSLNSPALDLRLPFREGKYFVAQGGSKLIVNHHGKSFSQRYALDIVRLNRFGVRARGLYPSDPERYAIFGSEVVAPCEGIVAAAEDGFPDLPVPLRDTEHRAGNYVAVESMGATIYLAHLLKGSICVKNGDHLQSGQTIGRVGNSGNTTEPHLHIHAEEGAYPGRFSGNRGIPVTFKGRFLVRNNRVTVRE